MAPADQLTLFRADSCQPAREQSRNVGETRPGHLADDHPTGRSKAVFFSIRALLQHAASSEVSSVSQTRFGAKYLIDGRISGPTGTAVLIRSVWFIESGERSPRFITAYPLRGV